MAEKEKNSENRRDSDKKEKDSVEQNIDYILQVLLCATK